MRRHLGLFALALAFALVVAVHQARAIYPPPVKDDGKFFTAEGVKKANAKIRDIYKKYRKDVVIETIDALSVDDEKKFKEEGKDKFWPKYALKRIDDLGVNGVYIVISKKPQRLQIEIDTGTRRTTFSNADRGKVVPKFTSRFKNEEFDEGLLDALDQIDATMKANTKSK